MNYNKVIKFFIGLFIDIGFSLLLELGPTLTILFALIYVILYIPNIYNFTKNSKNS